MSEFDNREIGFASVGADSSVAPTLTLAEVTIAAAWNVQGDPAQSSFVEVTRQVFGLGLPLEPNATTHNDVLTTLWLGPNSWLVVAGECNALAEFAIKRDALNSVGGALFDVSASRVAWSVSGMNASRALQKTCPLDLHLRTFAVASCAQSMLGHINALIYKRDAEPTFIVMVARSLAADAWQALCESAAVEGYRVALPEVFRHR